MNREVKTNTVRLNRIYNGNQLVDIVRGNVSSNPDVGSNNQSVNNLIASIDGRLETLESRSLQNPTTFDVRNAQRVNGYMEFYTSTSYKINNVDDLAYAVGQSEAALTQIISSNIMKINKLNEQVSSLESGGTSSGTSSTIDLNSITNEYEDKIGNTGPYLLKDYPIFMFRVGSWGYTTNYSTFGHNLEPFTIPDAFHLLIDIHNNTQQDMNLLITETIDPLLDDVETLKTTSGKCLEQKITTTPYKEATDEAIQYYYGYNLSKNDTMTRTVTNWIETLAQVAYKGYMEVDVTKQKITALEEQISQLQSVDVSSFTDQIFKTEITTIPYRNVSSPAIEYYRETFGDEVSQSTEVIKTLEEWIKDLARHSYMGYLEVIYVKEQISQLQSVQATSVSSGDDSIVIDQQLSTLNNKVTLIENNVSNNTNKIGVNATDISLLQNRIVDLETTVNTQSQLINELLTRIEAIESK